MEKSPKIKIYNKIIYQHKVLIKAFCLICYLRVFKKKNFKGYGIKSISPKNMHKSRITKKSTKTVGILKLLNMIKAIDSMSHLKRNFLKIFNKSVIIDKLIILGFFSGDIWFSPFRHAGPFIPFKAFSLSGDIRPSMPSGARTVYHLNKNQNNTSIYLIFMSTKNLNSS